MQNFNLTVVRNGQTMENDSLGRRMIIREGEDLLEALDSYGHSADGYQKLLVNEVPTDVSDLESFDVSGDVKVSFVNKSEGGK